MGANAFLIEGTVFVSKNTAILLDLEGGYGSFTYFHGIRPECRELIKWISDKIEKYPNPIRKWEASAIARAKEKVLPKLMSWPSDGIIFLV